EARHVFQVGGDGLADGLADRAFAARKIAERHDCHRRRSCRSDRAQKEADGDEFHLLSSGGLLELSAARRAAMSPSGNLLVKPEMPVACATASASSGETLRCGSNTRSQAPRKRAQMASPTSLATGPMPFHSDCRRLASERPSSSVISSFSTALATAS